MSQTTTKDMTFDTKRFLVYKKSTEDSLKKQVEFVNRCCEFIIDDLLYTDEGIARIDKKMDEALNQYRNGANIFETGLKERIIELPSGKLRRVSHSEVEQGKLADDASVTVDNKTGLSIVDLIKGPKYDPYWMGRHKVKTLPERIEEIFQEKFFTDVKGDYFKDKDVSRKEILEFAKEQNMVLPLVYYHYNSKWGPGGGGKFAIELDWSGESEENHSGFRAGKIRPRKVKKNKRRYNK